MSTDWSAHIIHCIFTDPLGKLFSMIHDPFFTICENRYCTFEDNSPTTSSTRNTRYYPGHYECSIKQLLLRKKAKKTIVQCYQPKKLSFWCPIIMEPEFFEGASIFFLFFIDIIFWSLGAALLTVGVSEPKTDYYSRRLGTTQWVGQLIMNCHGMFNIIQDCCEMKHSHSRLLVGELSENLIYESDFV